MGRDVDVTSMASKPVASMWSNAPVSAQLNSNEPSAAEVVEHGGGAVVLVTILAPPIGDPVGSRTTPRTAAAADAAALTPHTARRTPALRTRRQFRPHGPSRPECDTRPEVDWRRIDGDLPASRDRRKHEDAFRPAKRLADADAIATAERKVRELRPAGLGLGQPAIGIETEGVWKEPRIAVHQPL